MKIAIAGSTGFIGKHLIAALHSRGDQIVEVDLRTNPVEAAALCDGVTVIVNLAGAPVAGKRWTAEYKQTIHRSRVDVPRAFIAALVAAGVRCDAYISASAIGYYGTSETAIFTESSPPGDDFLAHVCIDWEREAHSASAITQRVCTVRTGVVLGKDGGALGQIVPIFKAGAGGVIASGKQWMSWIHIDDIVAIYLMAIDRGDGAYNGTAPNPATNAEFTKVLGDVLHRPTIAPVPTFAVKMLFGEGSLVVTKGQRAAPERLQQGGFAFKYTQLDAALHALLDA